MSDTIDVVAGARPWQPDEASEMVLELDRYNMPTAGILSDPDDGLHVFVLAAGYENPIQVWLYARITEDEATTLAELRGPEMLDGIAVALRNRWVKAALSDEYEVVDSSDLDAGEEHPAALVQRYMARLQSRLAHTLSGLTLIGDEIDSDSGQGRLAFV